MSNPLKIGVEFSQKGAGEIASAYEAAMRRVSAAGQKAEADLANAMGAGREDSLRRRAAEMRVKALAESAEKAKAAATAEFELSDALKAQAKELNASSHAQDIENKATEKATASKKAHGDALKGLSRAFPELVGHIRAMISPIGAAAVGIGFAISRIRAMAAEKVAVKAFSLEIENLGKQTQSMATIMASVSSMRENVVKAYTEMTDAVGGFEKALNAATKAIADNREINSDQDDALLQRTLLDIDQSADTPTNKAIRKSRAIRDHERGKEQGAISAAEADAARFSGGATTARQQQATREGEAASMDSRIAELTKTLQESQAALAQQQKYAERNLSGIDKELAEVGISLPGKKAALEMARNAGFGGKHLQQFIDDVDNTTRKKGGLESQRAAHLNRVMEAQGLVSADESRLAEATGTRDRLLGEARGFGSTALKLDEQAEGSRVEAERRRHAFRNVRPIVEGTEDQRLNFMKAGDDFQSREAALQRYQKQVQTWQGSGSQNAGPLIAAMQQFTGASTDNVAVLTQMVLKAVKDMEKLKQQFGGSAGSATLPR